MNLMTGWQRIATGMVLLAAIAVTISTAPAQAQSDASAD
jgi:hypothetical protein